MTYDVIIPIVERNLVTLPLVISGIRQNIRCERIFVVGKSCLCPKIKELPCNFIDEDSFVQNKGMTYNSLQKMIVERDSFAAKRTGWYLQQFIKIYFALTCWKEYYLIWDADTIPLRKIKLFDASGKPYFTVKTEHNLAYFTTMKRLFNNTVQWQGFSYISEHMIIRTDFMKELITSVMDNKSLRGESFHERVINSIETIDLGLSGFSEFETYGNYVNIWHPGFYVIRHLKSERNGETLFSDDYISTEALDVLSRQYDYITIENRERKIKITKEG